MLQFLRDSWNVDFLCGALWGMIVLAALQFVRRQLRKRGR